MNFLTHINKVRVSRQRISDLLVKVNWVLSQSHITAQKFLSVNGILSSVADFVQLGRLFLRPLQHYLSDCWKWSPDNMLSQIPILPELIPHLQWWLDEETLGRSAPSSSATVFVSYDRREQGQVGCSSGTTQSDSFGVVVSSGVTSAYQQSRNASGISKCISFPVTSSRLLCDGVNRQHISCDLHSGTGGNTFSLPVSGNQGITCSLQDAQHFSSGQIYSRSSQRPGRWVVSQTPITSIGMDTSSGSDQSDFSHVWLSSSRPFCNQTQSQTSSVYESGLRSSSVGSRRAFVRLGPTGRLRLSPTHSDSPNIGENQGEFVLHTPDRPLVAQEIVVQRSSQSPVQLSQDTSSQIRSSISKRQISWGFSNVPLTRLAVIRQPLQKKHFSVRASNLVASARRKSTRVVYDARWKLFSNWCI
ncbi:hypothetical protein DPMN_107111 [Dreissena polymorpha]|uniref:Uncharacterized protein n=1 Tax=Dreissena polymorpha TaxID=45954 RepID=A0A9D4K654_DREPO|nr:hypothetical protein DPMN_107111 [Dreissena polymorpha]